VLIFIVKNVYIFIWTCVSLVDEILGDNQMFSCPT
jgi:hypothetical protein